VVQLDLPLGMSDEARRPGASEGVARLLADRAIDAIRERFGWESAGYASVALGPRRSVPDAFRELAERKL
jgi:DNA polymerase-4